MTDTQKTAVEAALTAFRRWDSYSGLVNRQAIREARADYVRLVAAIPEPQAIKDELNSLNSRSLRYMVVCDACDPDRIL